MPKLSDLKKKAEELCPYPIGNWIDAKFDLFCRFADSAFAPCIGYKGVVVSVMVNPPEGNPYMAIVSEYGNTIPLDPKIDPDAAEPEPKPDPEPEPEDPEQLDLF